MENKIGAAIVGSIGFTTILQIVFIILKLCKVITWKWVFVLMPLIIEGGLVLILLLLVLIAVIIGVVRKWIEMLLLEY